MINITLENDIKEGVFENSLLKLTKGKVGGFSIEVFDEEFNSSTSYTYKSEVDRDKDYSILIYEITFK